MDTNAEKKFGFKDDVINAASAKALEVGKDNFKKEKDVILNPQTNETKSGTLPQGFSKIKNLRTFQGDVAEAIKNQNASILTITMAEEARKGKQIQQAEQILDPEKDSQASILERIVGRKPEKKPEVVQKPTNFQQVPVQHTTPPIPIAPIQARTQSAYMGNNLIRSSPKKNIDPQVFRNSLTIIASILLIVLGVGAVGGFYYLQKKSPTIANQTPLDQTIIPFETKEVISTDTTDKESFVQKINDLRNEKEIAANSVMYIGLTRTEETQERKLQTEELFTLLKTNAPGSLLRALDSEFMLGMYRTTENQPFLIIKLSSFDNAFDGMYKWEKTINKDIGAIFSSRTVPITSYTPTSTNTSTTSSTTVKTIAVKTLVNTDASLPSSFEDITIKNKDARVLKNSRGDTVLLYSFLDQHTLLITSSEEVLREVINKLVALKLVR